MGRFVISRRILATVIASIILLSSLTQGIYMVSAGETKSNVTYPITFAKLDGSEYPIVSPGLGTVASETTVDRSMNFTNNGNVRKDLHIARTNANVYKNNPVDFSGADLLTFELTIGDNGAWEYYKDYIKILLISGSNQLYIPAEDVAEGLSVVEPGKTQKVKFNLNNLDKSKLTAVKQVTIQLRGSTCDTNLIIKINSVEIDKDTDLDTDTTTPSYISFAKLDGSEYPIVSPGLGTTASETTVDRSMNFTNNGNVRNALHIARTNVYTNDPVDFSGADFLSFELTIGDNGAWEYYKDYFKILLISGSNSLYIPDSDVAEGLSAVEPGKTQKVTFNLNNLDKSNLTAVKQVTIQLKGSTCDTNLMIKITDVMVETDTDDLPPAGDEDDKEDEEITGVIFAKLDGSEYPIVSPGLGTTASETTVDRSMNFTNNGNVKNALHIARTNVYTNDPVDFSGADFLSFELTIGDNGAWEYYKDYFKILLISGSNSLYIPDSDVAEGLSAVEPGKTQKVTFNLNNLDKSNLTAVKQVTIQLKGSTCDTNLMIKITDVMVETDTDDLPPAGDEDDKEDEEITGVIFAKLDGSEYPIVSPGLGTTASETTVDRSMNFTNNGNVKNALHIARTNANVYKNNPVDFSGSDLLTFELTIGDNGAWEYYKDYFKILLISGSNQLYIPDADVAEGLSVVEPGKTQKVIFNLNNLDKSKLTAVKQVTIQLKGSTCDTNLMIKITDVLVEVDTDDLPPAGDEEEDSIPKPEIIAKLNGTEWPICHPGLSGQFNNPNYDAMNFDRYFSGIPSGDVRVFANVTRKAAKKASIDATKHNLFSFDMVIEDNGSWDTYKDGMVIKLKTLNNGDIAFSKSAIKNAFENVVPGEKCRIVLSLASIGKKNLSQVDGFYVGIGDTISEKVLHVKITNACVEYSDEYPTISDEPVLDNDSEKTTSVIFAKLDGTEWPIVHPGLSGKISGSADYDTRNFDRYINFVGNGDVKNRVNVVRTEVYKNSPADFTECNVLSFNVLVEDNGAWTDYKDKIKISITSTDNVSHPLATADIAKAFSSVIPGEWCKISISLAGLHKGELKNIKTVGFTLAEGSSDKNLHLRVLRIVGEYNDNFKEVPEEPSNNDPTLILNDEYGEYGWPASVTSDLSKFGNKSYAATTYINGAKGNNEGWLIRMGFMGSAALNRPLNIKDITANGTKGAIRFWIYAENAEEVRKRAASGAGSYCRYGSTGSWDTNLLEWRGWANQIIYDGWNEIVLPFENATKRGEPDLTNMKSFGLQFGGGKLSDVPKTTVYIDDIRISQNAKTSLPISYETNIKGAKMFQPFDETTGLSAETKMSSFGLDLKEKTQGMSSLKFSTEIGRFVWLYRARKNTVDATGYNAVELDIYVSHPEFFEYAGGTVELTSSGTWDQNEISWNLKTTKFNKGWNHIILSFDFANSTKDFKGNRDIDLSAINFMRFYSNGSDNYTGQDVVFRIDNMCFSKNGETKVDPSIVITNNTGYELYLTAKPNIIPKYGEIVVEKNDINLLPEVIRSKFASDKNIVIITPTYYKDSIEYIFKDTVTVHLSQEKITNLKNKYLYRLDVNSSFKKLSRVDNKSKKELTWDESKRLATYIISDVLFEESEMLEIEKQLGGNFANKMSIPLIVGISVALLAVFAICTIGTVVLIRKRKNKTNI